MTTCPKCGSRTIIGPRYRIGESGGEFLLYTCAPCGYQTTTRTRDATPTGGETSGNAKLDAYLESVQKLKQLAEGGPPVPDHLLKAAEAKHRLFVHAPHNEDDLEHPAIDGDTPSINAVDPVPGVVAEVRRAPEDPSSLPLSSGAPHPARTEESKELL